ncbi:heme-dependent catalase [Hanseniaspora valbyensis NRRL Y-1626]|uniref:Heme-dependent catalase n=1 Tax=Hanseniaspora valbyensis NRRL Y-1626 TaxID=766949 RepID=A0A1B7TEG7_9ASCO|nr:heme-dependent catalase [Hanseniaspora valbyensis NRRL Y-1626]
MVEKIYSYRNSGNVFTKNPLVPEYDGEGNLLLKDIHHFDQMTAFNRSTNQAERIVHSKGSGCFVKLKITDPLSDITVAKPFQNVGEEYDGILRISTVAGERGSGDHSQLRDPAGTSFKFKTPYGVMDWVFNNTPIFFIRTGGIQFEHFIKSQKRSHKNWLGADYDSTQFWDYLTLNPESIHQVTYLFGDRGRPIYPYVNAYSGHTLKFINDKNEVTYVQIHVIQDEGTKNFITNDEIPMIGPDSDRAFLQQSLEDGKKFTWTCYVQTMTPQQALEFKYNVNDLTKVWSHKDFPLRKFGTIETTGAITNYFEQVEQLAMSPANLIMDGIEPSNDPVLVARLFSYDDAHRFRFNSPNFDQLPINRPLSTKCPYGNTTNPPVKVDHDPANLTRDGYMGLDYTSDYSYIASTDNSIKFASSKTCPMTGLTVPTHSKHVGSKYRPEVNTNQQGLKKQQVKDYETVKKVDANLSFMEGVNEIDIEQATALYEKVYNDEQKERLAQAVIGHASTARNSTVKKRVPQYWGLVNKELGSKIAEGLKVEYEYLSLKDYLESFERLTDDD